MSKRTARLFVYKAKDGWRWRLKSANGKIVAESGEGYKRKITPLEIADRMSDMWFDVWNAERFVAENQK